MSSLKLRAERAERKVRAERSIGISADALCTEYGPLQIGLENVVWCIGRDADATL